MNDQELRNIKRGDTVREKATGSIFTIHNVQPAKDAVVAIRSVIICEQNQGCWAVDLKEKRYHPAYNDAVGNTVMVDFAGHQYKAILTEKVS